MTSLKERIERALSVTSPKSVLRSLLTSAALKFVVCPTQLQASILDNYTTVTQNSGQQITAKKQHQWTYGYYTFLYYKRLQVTWIHRAVLASVHSYPCWGLPSNSIAASEKSLWANDQPGLHTQDACLMLGHTHGAKVIGKSQCSIHVLASREDFDELLCLWIE